MLINDITTDENNLFGLTVGTSCTVKNKLILFIFFFVRYDSFFRIASLFLYVLSVDVVRNMGD